MITSSSSSSSQFQFFFTLPGVPVSSCGFFKHPQDPRYGASPDGIGETFALEVKTRAEDSESNLEKISGSHLVQTNFQMACTGGDITFLQSYSPEKEISHFFYVKRNDLLTNVVKDITDHTLENKTFIEWHYDEHSSLKNLIWDNNSWEPLQPLKGFALFGHG